MVAIMFPATKNSWVVDWRLDFGCKGLSLAMGRWGGFKEKARYAFFFLQRIPYGWQVSMAGGFAQWL